LLLLLMLGMLASEALMGSKALLRWAVASHLASKISSGCSYWRHFERSFTFWGSSFETEIQE
jgi:hypothetical protein